MTYYFMIFYQIRWFYLSSTLLNNLKVQTITFPADNSNWKKVFKILNHVEVNFKLWLLIKSGYYIVPRPSTALKPSNVATFYGQSKLEYSILDLDNVQQFTFQRDHGHNLAARINARINGKETLLSYIFDDDEEDAGMFLTTIIELNQGDKVSCKKGFNSWKHYHLLP